MTSISIILSILGALLLGAMSPGPSFVLVSRISITGSRPAGIAAALGMGVGGALFAVLALVGLIALLQQVEWLFVALKVCGGLYLAYLGLRIWRGAIEPLAIERTEFILHPARSSVMRSFWFGLATQVANPKTAVVYASIFAALLPRDPSASLLLALPPLVLLTEAGWYALVAILFSAPGPQRAYLRGKIWFDRIAGAVLGGLGLRLVAEEVR